ncbi:MAG: hypothetical protein KatS3mg114_1363 [Planctomycetaceae bacterium]|nr:MAG: hypothetical protein KatS3mg114_1363 [Planctomycetaceae bacterium]
MSLPRVLEPEWMDSAEEALAYDTMDHREVNRRFVDDLLQVWGEHYGSESPEVEVFDAGTGTAQIPIELVSRGCGWKVVAADAALEMLRRARWNVQQAGYAQQITCVWHDCKTLPAAARSYDIVMSNSLLHHLPQPWAGLRTCWALVRPGGLLFMRDLLRPSSLAELEHLVQCYAGDAHPVQRQLFRASLHAALTLDELQLWIEQVGITHPRLYASSDRHWTLWAFKPPSAA